MRNDSVVESVNERILHPGRRPATGAAAGAPRRPFPNHTKKSIDLTEEPSARRLRPCKVLLPDLTKMFHVKHFGTISIAINAHHLVGLPASGKPGSRNQLTIG